MSSILKSLTIKFFRKDMLVVGMFDEKDIYQFHFEEGLSCPFRGKAYIRTSAQLYRSQYSVKDLTAIVKVDIADPNEGGKLKSRSFFAQVGAIIYKGTAEFTNDKGGTDLFRVYEADLVSPLESLGQKRSDGYFYNRTVPEMIKALLNHQDSADPSYDHSYVLDVDKLKTPEWLNFSNMMVEQYDESNLSFLHRLMRVYGLNYVFSEGQPNTVTNALRLLFTHDGSFSTESSYEKQIVEMSSGQSFAGRITAEQVNFRQSGEGEDDDGDTESLNIQSSKDDRDAKAAQVEAIARMNLKRMRRLAGSSFSCTVQSPEIRVGMRLVLDKMFSGENSSRFLAARMVTDATTMADAVHPFEVKVFGVEAGGDTWVPGTFVALNSRGGQGDAPRAKLIPAVLCTSEGKTAGDSAAADIEGSDNTRDNDWFYAKLESSDQVVIFRNTAESSAVKATDLALGKRVMLSYERGVFYLSGFLAKDVSATTGSPVLASTVLKQNKVGSTNSSYKDNIYSQEKVGSISFTGYSSLQEYVTAQLASGVENIDRLIAAKAINDNNATLYDTDYLTTVFNSAADRSANSEELKSCTGSYRNVCTQVYEAYNKAKTELDAALADYQEKVNQLTEDPAGAEYKKKKEDLRSECNVADRESALVSAETDVRTLASRLVAYFSLSSSSVPEKSLDLSSSGAISLDAEGDLKISAKNITIECDKDMTIQAMNGSISMGAKKKITQSVFCSSISLKEDGASISAPAGFVGEHLETDDAAVDMFSSELAVKSYGGIKLEARKIKISGSDSVSVEGSLGAGVKVAWGAVKTSGSSFKFESQSKVEMYKNIGEYLEQFGEDIIYAVAAGHFAAGKEYNSSVRNLVCRTAHTIYDDFWDIPEFNEKRKKLKAKANDTNNAQAKYDRMDMIIGNINFALDMVEQLLETFYRVLAVIDDTSDTTPWLYKKFECMSISKLDMAKLYINYIKTTLNIISAFVLVARCNSIGFTDSATTLKMDPVSMKLEGKKMDFNVQSSSLFNIAIVDKTKAFERSAIFVNPPANP